jgi:hypothetical protein
MSDTFIEAVLIDNRRRRRAELQQQLDCLLAGWMDQVLDLDQKSTAINEVIHTIVDYDAYVWERRAALFVARVLDPVDLQPE